MTSPDMFYPFALRSWSANLIHTDDDGAIGWLYYALIVHFDGYDPLDLLEEIAVDRVRDSARLHFGRVFVDLTASIPAACSVANVDEVFARAVAAGMQVEIPVADFFWGERYGSLRDAFGHVWGLASRIEDLSPRQIQERADAFYNQHRS